MKKIIAATAAALGAVALTACSAQEEAPAAQAEVDTNTVYQVPGKTGTEKLALGDTVNLTQDVNGERDVNVTVTSVSVSDTCHGEASDYGMEPGWSGQIGGQYIQVSGKVDAVTAPFGFSIPQWTGVKTGGEVVEVEPARECATPQGETFLDSFGTGQHAEVTEQYWVSEPINWLVLDEPYESSYFGWPVQ